MSWGGEIQGNAVRGVRNFNWNNSVYSDLQISFIRVLNRNYLMSDMNFNKYDFF
jgi:hypothetical protein